MNADNILVIANNKALLEQLIRLLHAEGYSNISYAVSTSDARKKVAFLDPSIIIINSPLGQDPGIDFILDIGDRTSSGILVLSKMEYFQDLQYELQQIGALIVSKPLNRGVLLDTLHFMTHCFDYIGNTKGTKKDILTKEEEKAFVGEAKTILMKQLNLSEPCAHRYMQKQAMNLRKSQFQVATQIISYFST